MLETAINRLIDGIVIGVARAVQFLISIADRIHEER